MRSKISLFIACLAVFFVTHTNAGTIIGSLTTVTTAQTNSPTFMTNQALINMPVVYVSSIVTTSNSYTGCFRWSFDNVTFYTNASPVFYPTVTNGTVTINPQVISVPVYVQMLAITNAGQIGAMQIGAFTP